MAVIFSRTRMQYICEIRLKSFSSSRLNFLAGHDGKSHRRPHKYFYGKILLMKYFHTVVLGIFISVGMPGCDTSPGDKIVPGNADSIKKIIIDINNQMISSMGDKVNGAQKYMSFCADKIIANNYDGDFSTSPSEVAHDLSDGVTEPPHNFTFILRNKTAFLSFLYTSYETFDSDTIYHHLRVTKTFIYDAGRWKMASVSNSLQRGNYYKPVAEMNSARLKTYAGVYQWRPALADTISVSGGILYSSSTGETSEQNFPINDSEYMTKNDFGRVAFQTDSKGKVKGYIYTTFDGQKIHAKKMQ